MGKITHNPNSEYRRISFVIGLTREGHYQLGQLIKSENAHIYSIDDSSKFIGEGSSRIFIRSFDISLINSNGEVYVWYTYEKGSKDSVTFQINNEFVNI